MSLTFFFKYKPNWTISSYFCSTVTAPLKSLRSFAQFCSVNLLLIDDKNQAIGSKPEIIFTMASQCERQSMLQGTAFMGKVKLYLHVHRYQMNDS